MFSSIKDYSVYDKRNLVVTKIDPWLKNVCGCISFLTVYWITARIPPKKNFTA